MVLGKNIRIFLPDGNVTGLKFAELVNNTIKAISFPRSLTASLAEHSESSKPGVYFLFGEDEKTGESKVYIGEAESVYSRLQSHVNGKDFWNEAIFFISKDDNITKSHVKYLESRIIDLANKAGRYKIENAVQPQMSMLPLADQHSMEEFLLQIKMLIGVLGHKVLDPVNKQVSILTVADTSAVSTNIVSKTFKLVVSGMKATAITTNEGMVVLKDSEATKNSTPSLGAGFQMQRQKLIDNGSLADNGGKYVFTKDVLFSSSSAAAAAVVGYNISGPANWKDEQGRSLKEIEEMKIQQASKQPVLSFDTI